MLKEYKLGHGWKVFAIIFSPLLIALFGMLLVMPFIPALNDNLSPSILWFSVPLSLGMMFLGVVTLRDAIKGKFVIDFDRLYNLSTLGNRELLFTEIKGYRTDDKYIYIEPNVQHLKKVKVTKYISGAVEIERWLAERYPDLDQLKAEEEKEAIFANNDFGFSFEERTVKFNQASSVAKILNVIGGLTGAWTLFFPNPYKIALWCAIAVPLICIPVIKYYKGLIRIDKRKDSPYPSIFIAFLLPCVAVFLRALLDYNIFDHSKIWIPMFVIALVMTAIVCLKNAELQSGGKKAIGTIVVFTLFSLAYGFGSIIFLNCYYDQSTPKMFHSKILSKRIRSGKTTSYYLELEPWGERKTAEDVDVSKDFYFEVNESDTVNIYFMKGKFDIPWFELSK
ncbi:hypothetical protein [Pedobacter frigidisoli]|uniref:hypothetical protein n=1 Tax=Pedobacter frigidisoli TaxID=2530455 RepID=UPI00292FEAB4|nr:hypothetical protein [Pedobacter frigidisoli]